jgi:IPT/TIG domain
MASSSAPTISSFSPISGLPGTRVTINGSNFSVADPVDLSVLFNVTEAVLESVSTTSIVAIVPLRATTGLLQVGTPSGTASSTSNFTVTTPG